MKKYNSNISIGRTYADDFSSVKYKVGDTIMVAVAQKSINEYYPWNGERVPLEIKQEYRNFYVCEVLTHSNTSNLSVSYPYNVTIDKRDIIMGLFDIL